MNGETSNTTSQIRLEDDDPSDLDCNFNYKRNGIFLHNIDVLLTVVGAAAGLAISGFSSPQPDYSYWLVSNRIIVAFRDTKIEGDRKFQTKTILWSLRKLLCFLQSGRYAEATWTAGFRGQPVLGFGGLSWKTQNEVDGDAATDGENNVEGSTNATVAEKNGVTDEERVTVTDIRVLPDGHKFQPFDIYITILSLLIKEAETNPEEHSLVCDGYYAAADLTIAVTATSTAAANRLLNKYIIESLWDIARKLPNIREVDAQWKETDWLVRVGGSAGVASGDVGAQGRIVGRGVMFKGKFSGDELQKMVDLGTQEGIEATVL